MKVTPEDVLKHDSPTEGFLCSISANTYGIDFLSFSISDYDSKEVIFELDKANRHPEGIEIDFDSSGGLSTEDCFRKIKYTFSQQVLRLPLIQTSLTFASIKALPTFRLIERHYFNDELIKNFDFKFGFCIPNSVNSWDSIYDVPTLHSDLVESIVQRPFEATSDSFYFVDDELVIHNKASYKYV